MAANKLKLALAGSVLAYGLSALSAGAAAISTNIAGMQAMDKNTGMVRVIDLPVNSEVKYGSFSIVVRSCKTRPPEETPENFAFVDIVDDYKGKNPVNIFRGWMISSSPSLNPVEHPIYDIWLLNCENDKIDPRLKIMTAEELKARNLIPQAKPQNNEEEPDVENIPDHVLKGEPAPVVVAEPEQEAETSEADTGRKPLPETGTGATAEDISAPASQTDVAAVDDVRDGTPHSLINISSEAAPEPSVPVSEPPAEVSGSLPQEPDIPALQPTEETSFSQTEAKIQEAAPLADEPVSLSVGEINVPADDLPPVEEIEENGMLDDQLIDFSE